MLKALLHRNMSKVTNKLVWCVDCGAPRGIPMQPKKRGAGWKAKLVLASGMVKGTWTHAKWCVINTNSSLVRLFPMQLGHTGERKEEEPSGDFTRREKHHFGLQDLEIMETLGNYGVQPSEHVANGEPCETRGRRSFYARCVVG